VLGPQGLNLLEDTSNPFGVVTANSIHVTDQDNQASFSLTLGRAFKPAVARPKFDVGFPGLGLSVTAAAQLAIGWQMPLTFGVQTAADPRQAFYVDFSQSQDVKVDVLATLPQLDAYGQYGPFSIHVTPDVLHTDPNDPTITTPNPSLLAVTLDVNIQPASGRSVLLPLLGEQITTSTSIDGGATVNLQVETNPFDNQPGLPQLFFEINIGLHYNNVNLTGNLNTGPGNLVTPGAVDYFEFNNITLNLGSYAREVIKPVADAARPYLAPFDYILNPQTGFLYKPVPIYSDVTGDPSSILQIAGQLKDARVLAAIEVIHTLSGIEQLLQNTANDTAPADQALLDIGGINLTELVGAATRGNVAQSPFQTIGQKFGGELLPDELRAKVRQFGPKAGGLLPNPNDKPGIVTGYAGNLGFKAGKLAAKKSEPGAVAFANIVEQDPPYHDDGTPVNATTGLQFDALNDPTNLFRLVLGQYDKVNLVSFIVAGGFDFNVTFSPFKVLDIPRDVIDKIHDIPSVVKDAIDSATNAIGHVVNTTFHGEVSLNFNFTVGYDASGVARYAQTHNTEDLKQGFFVSADGSNGIFFHVDIGADGGVNLGVLDVGVSGGVSGDLSLQLVDPSGSGTGKIRYDALQAMLRHDANPLSLFVAGGSINYSLGAHWDVNFQIFSFSGHIGFQGGTSVSFSVFNDPLPQTPILATRLPDGTLRINVGAYAADRLFGNLSAGNDVVTITHDSGPAGDETVDVTAFGLTQTYSGVSSIPIREAGGGNSITPVLVLSPLDIDSGDGNNLVDLRSTGADATITGGTGNDTFYGGTGGYVVSALDGNDLLDFSNSTGPTQLSVAFGNATLIAGRGNDLLQGGAGNDSLVGGIGADTLIAGSGNSVLVGSSDGDPAPSLLLGGDGNDTLRGGGGNDTLIAGNGNSTLIAGGGNQLLVAGGGNDSLQAFTGSDTLEGGSGADTLTGGSGNDTLTAGSGDSTLVGGKGNELLVAGIGDDSLQAGIGQDTLAGGPGNDTLSGGDGFALLQGGSGDTVFNSGTGSNRLVGGTANNVFHVVPGFGASTVIGGGKSDALFFAAGVVNGTDVPDTVTLTKNTITVAGAGEPFPLVTSFQGITSMQVGVAPPASTRTHGTNWTIESTIAGPTEIDTGSTNDQVNVEQIDGPTTVNLGPGNSTLTVGSPGHTLAGIGAGLTVNAGTGSDTLVIDESHDPKSATGTMTPTTVTGLGLPAGITYDTGHPFAAVDVQLSGQGDGFTVNGTGGGQTNIHVGTPPFSGQNLVTLLGNNGPLNLVGVGAFNTIGLPLYGNPSGGLNLNPANVTYSGFSGILIDNSHNADGSVNTNAVNWKFTGNKVFAGSVLVFDAGGVSRVGLTTSSAANTITVLDNTVDTFINAGPQDTITVGNAAHQLAGIQGPLHIFGGNSVTLDDSGNTAGEQWIWTGLELDGTPNGMIAATAHNTHLLLGSGNNSLTITGTGPLTVTTGNGNNVIAVGLVSYAAIGPTTLNLGSGANAVRVVGDLQGTLTVHGGGNTGLSVIRSDDTADHAGIVTASSVTGLGISPINYDGLANVNVTVGSGHNTLDVQSTPAGPNSFGASGGTVNFVVDGVNGPTSFTQNVADGTLTLPVHGSPAAPSFVNDLSFKVNTLRIDNSDDTQSAAWSVQNNTVFANGNAIVPTFGARTVDVVAGSASSLDNTITVAAPGQSATVNDGSISFPLGGLNFDSFAAAGNPRDVTVSPDGSSVYSPGFQQLDGFSRDPQSGRLTPLQQIHQGDGGVFGLAGADAVAVDPDGKFVYAGGSNSNPGTPGEGIGVFRRDPGTGQPTFVQSVAPFGTAFVLGNNLNSISALALSSDGTQLYAVGQTGTPDGTTQDELVVFNRDTTTGQLTLSQLFVNNPAGTGDTAPGSTQFLSGTSGPTVTFLGSFTGAKALSVVDESTGVIAPQHRHLRRQPR
jgi:Ca2+-binding RTX toxin-like protein